MCGNNVSRKYWLKADRPNEAEKMWPFFAPCPDFMGAMPPLTPSSYTPANSNSHTQKLFLSFLSKMGQIIHSLYCTVYNKSYNLQSTLHH